MQEEESRYRKIRRNIGVQSAMFLVMSILEYVELEAFLGDDITQIGLSYGVRNVLLLVGCNLLLTSLFHQLRPAFLISETGILILGAANYFVDAFRGYGIVFMDLFAVQTAANVAGTYTYTLSWEFWSGLLLGVAGIALCFLVPPRRKNYLDKKCLAGGAVGLAVSAAFFLWINLSAVFWEDVSSLTWDHNIGMSEYGYVLYVTANAGDSKVEKPEGYSPEKVEEILSRYEVQDIAGEREDGSPSGSRNNDSAKGTGESLTGKKSPNIIMIMNEAFSDLSVLGRLATNEPYLTYFNSLKENTIRGYAVSSVYGGYTANSEFEFLTGCTKAFLPGNPYLQYMNDYLPSVVSNIKAQEGYQKAVAIHPYHASGYNRNRVYPLLYFDDFLSLEDFKNPVKVRKYVSDQSDFDMIKKLYETKAEDSSLCLFNVTMQNHSAYDDSSYQFEEPVELTSYELQFEAEQYLSLIKMSDEAFRDLILYFKEQEEPVIVVMFGDHQPHLPDYFYQKVMGSSPDDFTREEAEKRYLVPFVIWANYDIEEKQIEKTSLNYLSVLMMQAAGLELTDYQRFLLELYDNVPVISANGYYDKQGNFYEFVDQKDSSQQENVEKKSAISEKTKEMVYEYELVQYNYLFDKENRLDEHYVVSGEGKGK